jgi:hypothetical protein
LEVEQSGKSGCLSGNSTRCCQEGGFFLNPSPCFLALIASPDIVEARTIGECCPWLMNKGRCPAIAARCRQLTQTLASRGSYILRAKKIGETANRGAGAAKELAYTVPAALLKPTAVFRGVREEGERNWLCYCSVPAQRYDLTTGEIRRIHPGRVFLVFVNDDNIVYNWRWEQADSSHPKLPVNHASRFEEKVL